MAFERPQYIKDNNFNTFIKCEGLEYGKWARGSDSEGDLITRNESIVESLLRDWVHSERDLEADSNYAVVDYVELPDAMYSENDYYNGCYIHNIDSDWVDTCTDYTGASKRFETSAVRSTTTGDRVFLTNVNCNINTTSFDNASRSLWQFARVINEKVNAKTLLDEICFESHCVLIPTNNEYKLVKLDNGTSVGTLGTPLVKNGTPLMSVSLTDSQRLYNKFTFNYAFDYARSEYLGEVFCNKNGSSNSGVLTSTWTAMCDNVEKNYKINRPYEVNLNWIYDQTTAEALAKKIIAWHTTQRLRVNGTYQLSDAVQYEIGDLVKVNYSRLMPSSKNNSAIFMITGKHIDLSTGNGRVTFNLVEMI